MKFGGTSVADADRVRRVAGLVAERRDRRPVVVVSALAGVTDRLLEAAGLAREGRREALDPVLSDLARRHRWALAGSVEDSGRKHDLGLEIDTRLDDLRQLLRAIRILGETTARALDTVLAFGELMSSRIVATALADRDVDAVWVDPRDVLATDRRFGAAEADLDRTAELSASRLEPIAARGAVPVLGGFVGATPEGITTTLGRGGSDTSAAVLGAAVGAEEIQIWTDVDGLMTADPRIVPTARPLDRVSFAEAAELSYYGAKVLHPASIEPAVRRGIPVRVLNTLRPEARGTLVLREVVADAPAVASVASRSGLLTVRVRSPRLRIDPSFLLDVAGTCARCGATPDVTASSEIGALVALRDDASGRAAAEALARHGPTDVRDAMAVVCVVGAGLAGRGEVRGRVLAALAELEPEAVAVGGSSTSVTAVVPEAGLADAVRAVHSRFFEEGPVP